MLTNTQTRWYMYEEKCQQTCSLSIHVNSSLCMKGFCTSGKTRDLSRANFTRDIFSCSFCMLPHQNCMVTGVPSKPRTWKSVYFSERNKAKCRVFFLSACQLQWLSCPLCACSVAVHSGLSIPGKLMSTLVVKRNDSRSNRQILVKLYRQAGVQVGKAQDEPLRKRQARFQDRGVYRRRRK